MIANRRINANANDAVVNATWAAMDIATDNAIYDIAVPVVEPEDGVGLHRVGEAVTGSLGKVLGKELTLTELFSSA